MIFQDNYNSYILSRLYNDSRLYNRLYKIYFIKYNDYMHKQY